MVILIVMLIWYFSGVGSFVYWWTSELDLTIGGVFIALLVGLLGGPIAFFAGWVIHGKSTSVVVMKARK